MLASGKGIRTGNTVPKQFITVNDIPIITYSMLNLQSIDFIDEIYVVCSSGWSEFIVSYSKQYEIEKFRGTIEGGDIRFLSINNGIHFLYNNHLPDDLIFIVDANRPLIPESVFMDCAKTIKTADCVVSTDFCYDSIFYSKDGKIVDSLMDRTVLFKGQTPECALLKDLFDVYIKDKKDNSIDLPTAALFLKHGKTVKTASGSSKSFKITTADDIEMFKAMIMQKSK